MTSGMNLSESNTIPPPMPLSLEPSSAEAGGTGMQVDPPQSQHTIPITMSQNGHLGSYQVRQVQPAPTQLTPYPNPQPVQTAAEWWNQAFPGFQQLQGWKDVLAQAAQNYLPELFPPRMGRPGVRETTGGWGWGNTNIHQSCEEKIATLKEHRNQEQRKAAAYQQDYQSLYEVYKQLKAENEAFRAQIFSIGTGRAPIHEESYYVQKFESLKGLIEQGSLRLCRAQAKGEKLSIEAEKATLQALVETGAYGEQAVKIFGETKYTLPFLYNLTTWRIALIRHIVAIFLLDRVFSPFAFGISEEFSNGLKCVQADIVERGTHLIWRD